MTKPVIPWMGGKRRLANDILPLMPKHKCYVEPFAGGAAILLMKDPSKVEVLNDIDGELVNLHRIIKHHLAEFVQQFRWSLVSRKMFEWTTLEKPETLTDIQRAARFYYLQKLCFGGKTTGRSFGTSTTSSPRINLLRIEEELSDLHIRLSNVLIECLEWMAVVTKYDRKHTLFYLDPPYWKTAGYGLDFGWHEYQDLADVMRTMAGKAILSINDCEEIREGFDGFPMVETKIAYTLGGKGRADKASSELIISNF